MEEIVSFEYSTSAKALDAAICEYKVDGKKILKIDFPDDKGFVAIHEKDGKTEYVKAAYMKFETKK
ncbi:hypothetical protein [Lactiplantibacillus herbarum]|uniref:hypothetical protein n=1 Tax=Lactiplantibacillus herbarum TaxID=1670446 RepID=UPI00064FAC51|nr:hypothetical protein [Lactiplantibacillus herbarum]